MCCLADSRIHPAKNLALLQRDLHGNSYIMSRPTLRKMAAELDLSIATLSRTLHDDPRVHPSTRERVKEKLRNEGYVVDPVVSAGMSKIRQGDFYRETLAWCGSTPPGKMPWLEPFFRSAEGFGARLGYRLEYFHFSRPDATHLRRLASIWKARGIRGVLLGPFHGRFENLAFPWEDFAWVVVGHAVDSPILHSVGRDYDSDIRAGLAWLEQKGCQRPCFLLDPAIGHIFREPFLRATMEYYRNKRTKPRTPYFELEATHPHRFRTWLRMNRPDSILLPGPIPPGLLPATRDIVPLPTVLFSPPDRMIWPDGIHFTVRFEEIGRSCVSLLHRLLFNGDLGIPAYKETVIISSKCPVAANCHTG